METTIYNWNEVLNTDSNSYKLSNWENSLVYMSFLLKHSKPGKWLDVGCGIGNFVECCTRYGIDCIGVEGHESAKEVAQKIYPQIQIDIKDITESLPYEDNSFSVVLCNQVIEHIPVEKPQKVINEIYRVLRDDGVAFIKMPSIFNKENAKEPSHVN